MMQSDTSRKHARIWRHDGYTLRRLRIAIKRTLDTFGHSVQSKKLLDFGAGTAPYKELFTTRGFEYESADIEGEHNYRVSPGNELNCSRGRFDLVVSFQVLEHVWDLDWYFSEINRVLRDDGSLILSTHGTWLYHPHPTDFRRWTRDGLIKEIESRGFVVEDVHAVVGPLAWTTQFKLLAYNFILKRASHVGVPFTFLLNSIFYLRMTVEDWVTPTSMTEQNAAVYVVLASRRKEQ